MNFYKHHIGDYDQATRHLSFIEDAAYCRLLRKYYAEERPLPKKLEKILRLIGARTKEEKKAVEVVLEEFFILEEDGWHQSRCDGELEAAQIKAQKNREIGKLGGRPKKVETQTKPTDNPNGLHFETQTVSENNPSQTPDTRHQTPDYKTNTASDNSNSVGTDTSQSAPASPAEISKTMRSNGVLSQPADPRIMALSAQGVSVETVAAACAEAKAAKPNESIGPAYVIAIVSRWAKEAAGIDAKGAAQPPQRQNQPSDDWWKSNPGIERKGRELGLFARGQESYNDFKDRIFAKLREGGTAA